MEIDEALLILSEIATGNKEKEAIKVVKDSILGLVNESDCYRHLYEGAVKKMERYRDIASRPDIFCNLNAEQNEVEEGEEK